MLKDRARNINRIVKGKLIDDIDGGIVGMGKPLGELGSGRHLNFVRQSPDHLTENPDLIFGVAAYYQ